MIQRVGERPIVTLRTSAQQKSIPREKSSKAVSPTLAGAHVSLRKRAVGTTGTAG
jgi:hypothetical protein